VGQTIGGQETLTYGQYPEEAWIRRATPREPRAPRVTCSAPRRRPAALDGRALTRWRSSGALESLPPLRHPRHPPGDTIIGTKGRVAFEAPAAECCSTRTVKLEKGARRAPAAPERSRSPAATGTRALLTRCAATSALLLSCKSACERVRLRRRTGNVFIEGVESPYS
jgi:argininosuccinate synthase